MYPASGEGSNVPPIKTLPALEKYNPPEKNSSGRSKKTAKWFEFMLCLAPISFKVICIKQNFNKHFLK